MNDETYEALKRVISDEALDRKVRERGQFRKDVEQIENWIDETAKEHK